MNILNYWAERLEAKRPLGTDALWAHGSRYRSEDPDDTWPRAVSREAFYMDYLQWFEERIVSMHKESEYFAQNPDQIPAPATELEFYNVIKPWLYIYDKKRQTRSYTVSIQAYSEKYQKWVPTRVKRYFVKMGTWEEHVAAFEYSTGVALEFASGWTLKGNGYQERAEQLAKARATFAAWVDGKREQLPESMQRP